MRLLLVSIVVLGATVRADTFGKVLPIRGAVSDIALDETRNRLYIANFSAGQIEVMNTSDQTFNSPLIAPTPISSIALSPDKRYLVAGTYENFPDSPAHPMPGGLTVFDLDSQTRSPVRLDSPVLSVAFGNGSKCLVVTSSAVLLFDPASGEVQNIGISPGGGIDLPVVWGTFPPDITYAATGVSTDGQVIVVFAGGPSSQAVLLYRVGETSVRLISFESTPAAGPRVVSVNRDGSSFLAGWVLFDARGVHLAEFPYPNGSNRVGGHAFDAKRNVFYAHIPAPADTVPVLHIVDTDNLTVGERISLPQMIAGRSILSSDMNTMYAVADSGIMIFPMEQLWSRAPRIYTEQEDVVFRGGGCVRGWVSGTLEVKDRSSGNVPFALTLPSGYRGIRLSAASGTTPAKIRIDVDPTAFQSVQTSVVTLTISSPKAVNIPFPVRLLINSWQTGQRGTSVYVPGKIVDVMTDPVRPRIYLVRQDRNLILVYDSMTYKEVARLRTGNTPMQLAITADNRYLIVGHDHSQFAGVFDLDQLKPVEPILSPGVYPQSFAVANYAFFATARAGSVRSEVPWFPNLEGERLYRVSFDSRSLSAPISLGVYNNRVNDVPYTSALAVSRSRNYVLLARTDGAVAMFDAVMKRWVISRLDAGQAGGAYGVLSDDRFIVGDAVLDKSLSRVAKLGTGGAGTSGTVELSNGALHFTAGAPFGLVHRINRVTSTVSGTRAIVDGPLTATTLTTAKIGQVGQSILPFTRTAALLPDDSAVVVLTQLGFTMVKSNFDAPAPIPSIGAIRNMADGTDAIAPGSLVLITGTGLAPDYAWADSDSALPTTLGETCLNLGDAVLPLFWVSPTAIAAQVPFMFSGEVPLNVGAPGGPATPSKARIRPFAPAVFQKDGAAAVTRYSDGSMVSTSNPVRVDDTIQIYVTGMGQTQPDATAGQPAPLDALLSVTAIPEVLLGDKPLAVMWAGLVPGQIGVYQINARVPSTLDVAVPCKMRIKQGSWATEVEVPVSTR